MSIASVKTKIFVVSLADATERRNAFTQRAAGASVDWKFFDAHRTLNPFLDHDPQRVTRHHGRSLMVGELGCYSSHVSIWLDLLEDEADQYIILEDDVIVDWKMIQMLSEHDFSYHGQNYVRLYYKCPCSSVVIKQKYPVLSTSLLQLFGKAYGTQGYIITRDGAAKLVKACREVRRPIDDQLDRYWEHGVPNLSIFPFPLLDEAVPSDIGMARFDNRYSRPPLKRKLYLWRDALYRRVSSLAIRLSLKFSRRMKTIRNVPG